MLQPGSAANRILSPSYSCLRDMNSSYSISGERLRAGAEVEAGEEAEVLLENPPAA